MKKFVHFTLCLTVILIIVLIASCSLFFPYQVSITVQGEGTVTADPPNDRFAPNATVHLSSAPVSGWYFDHWEGAVTDTSNPLALVMDGDKVLTAVFKEVIPYTLAADWFASSSGAFLFSQAAQEGDTVSAAGSGGETYPLVPKVRNFSPPPADRLETDRIIVRYREGVLQSQGLTSRVETFGTEIKRSLHPKKSISIVKVDRGKAAARGKSLSRVMDEALGYYRSLPEVAYAEPDYKMWAFFTPDDTYYTAGYQWALQQLGMPAVWDTVTGAGVVVAVIDTGIDTSVGLTDLVGVSFTGGMNFVANPDTTVTYDDEGHGSHVAGTIAQATDNSLGVAGMAYGVTLMPLKALDSTGAGYLSDIAAAIEWAADNGAAIISMSLGGDTGNQTLLDACAYAYNKGVAIFAASGNDGISGVAYPAAYDDFVLAVGATNSSKARASFSNYGSSLDIMAPGVNILQQSLPVVLNPDTGNPLSYSYMDIYLEKYYHFSGTSMATPHVAALGALLKSKYPSLSPHGIYDAIMTTAEDLGTAGWDAYYGSGLINPAAALNIVGSLTEVQDTKNGTVNPRTDTYDDFTLNASLGSIRLNLNSANTAADLDLYLFDANGNVLAASEGDSSTESITFFTGSVSGTYKVRVKVVSNN